MTCCRWTHSFDFWAETAPQPGMNRFAFGQAHQPHRCMTNHTSKLAWEWGQGAPMTVSGWTHFVDFWAYRVPGDTATATYTCET